MLKRLNVALFCCLTLFTLSSYAAIDEHTGLWTGFAVVGPSRWGPDIKYYYDAQLQLIDDRYKFDEIYGSFGLGKACNDNWLFFIINTFSISESFSGQINYDYKIYEEANWIKITNNNTTISTRSRLEERKRFSQSAINVRLRERLMFRLPIKQWQKHSFVIYDEIFLNFNRPDWVVDKFFEQNRFFIGIGTILSKRVTVDIGYLNKLVMSNPLEMTNILLINFNVTGKSNYIKE